MRLAELANINTGLVTARKQARITDQEIIKYRILNLKAINEKGYIEDNLVEEFGANERIKPVYLTKARDIVVRYLRSIKQCCEILLNDIQWFFENFRNLSSRALFFYLFDNQFD